MSKNINIIQFKEWAKGNYEYGLITDLSVLKKVEINTWNEKTRTQVSGIKERLAKSTRPARDKEMVKKYAYCLYYLNNFIPHYPENFDNLLALVNRDQQISIEDLRELKNDYVKTMYL